MYPPVDSPEKYRRIPQDGELERLVRANDKNLDEYAVASIGFTKVSIDEEQTKAKIEILGMAYLMKRINMVFCQKEQSLPTAKSKSWMCRGDRH